MGGRHHVYTRFLCLSFCLSPYLFPAFLPVFHTQQGSVFMSSPFLALWLWMAPGISLGKPLWCWDLNQDQGYSSHMPNQGFYLCPLCLAPRVDFFLALIGSGRKNKFQWQKIHVLPLLTFSPITHGTDLFSWLGCSCTFLGLGTTLGRCCYCQWIHSSERVIWHHISGGFC